MKLSKEVFEFRVALLQAKYEAEKVKDIEDGGTSNMDTPTVYLYHWSEKVLQEAFEGTGLIPSKHGNIVFVLGACEGQGFRRTAMAEAFSRSLRHSGYDSAVDYRVD